MPGKKPSRGESPRSAETRFKKGAPSPNPKGRPKGSPNRSRIIREVLGRLVTGDIDGQRKKITITEASLMRLSQQALAGDKLAIKMVLALWKESEDALANEHEEQYPFTAADRAVIEEIYARMRATRDPSGG